MKKFLPSAALAFFALTGAAHASTLDIFLSAGTGGSFFGVSSAALTSGALNVNVNLASAQGSSQLVLGPNAFIVTGTNANHKDPSSDLTGAGNAGQYLSVQGGGAASFSVAPGDNQLGFSWGTIDTYNQLVLTDSKGNTYTINGTELAAALGVANNGTVNQDVDFIDPNGALKTAVFTSTTNSFEIGNLSEADSAPLPPALPLFGAAIVGLAFFGRRAAKSSV